MLKKPTQKQLTSEHAKNTQLDVHMLSQLLTCSQSLLKKHIKHL